MHRLAALRSVGGYVRRVGSGVAALVRRAVMPCVGGYLYQMGGGVLGLVGRAVAFLEFEDGWDAAGYICLSLGLALMLLGTLAAPDLPALYLRGDQDQVAGCAGDSECDPFQACRVRLSAFDTCEPADTGCSQLAYDNCKLCFCLPLEGAGVCTCTLPATSQTVAPSLSK